MSLAYNFFFFFKCEELLSVGLFNERIFMMLFYFVFWKAIFGKHM